MKDFKEFLHVVLQYIFPFIVLSIIYLLFAFIAKDWSPANWMLYTTTGGRCISVALFMVYSYCIIEYYDNEL